MYSALCLECVCKKRRLNAPVVSCASWALRAHTQLTLRSPSTKGLLPILWSLFPHHPNLLPTYWTKAEAEAALGKHFVEKPLLGREGQNVSIHAEQGLFTRGGEYADTGFIYQQARSFSIM